MPKVVPEYKEEAKKRIIAAGIEVMSEKGRARQLWRISPPTWE